MSLRVAILATVTSMPSASSVSVNSSFNRDAGMPA